MEYQSYVFSIQSLHLENFRRFDRIDVEFSSQMTVLTAPNGGGKSAVLRALAQACHLFLVQAKLGHIYLEKVWQQIMGDRRLVRQAGGGMTCVAAETKMQCAGVLGFQTMHPHVARWGYSGPKPVENGSVRLSLECCDESLALQDVSALYDEDQSIPYPLAPLIVAYDTRRLSQKEEDLDLKTKLDRFEGYLGCLTVGANNTAFRDWFSRVSRKASDEKLKFVEQGKTDFSAIQSVKQISLVRKAINMALEDVGWRDAEWDEEWRDVVMTHREQGTLPYGMLSDGIQNIFNLVADMAHRAVRLNPCADVDLFDYLTGLVLIDEVDMYLHPSWQQKILATLCKIFPKVQFVISTHSPQVLSTLKRDEIRIISQDDEGHWHADIPEVNPYAKDAGVALAGIFNTPAVPEVAESHLIAEVEQLYRSGDTAAADAKLEELKKKGVDISESSIRFWKFLAGK